MSGWASRRRRDSARRAHLEAVAAQGRARDAAGSVLLKNSPPEQLVEAVRAVAAGEGLLSTSVTRRVIGELARRSPSEPPRSAALDELTARTAKTHVSRILMKLGLRDRVRAVVFAYETGVVRAPGA